MKVPGAIGSANIYHEDLKQCAWNGKARTGTMVPAFGLQANLKNSKHFEGHWLSRPLKPKALGPQSSQGSLMRGESFLLSAVSLGRSGVSSCQPSCGMRHIGKDLVVGTVRWGGTIIRVLRAHSRSACTDTDTHTHTHTHTRAHTHTHTHARTHAHTHIHAH